MSDEAFREKLKSSQKQRYQRLYKTDPLFREILYLRQKRSKMRRTPSVKHRITIEEVERKLAVLVETRKLSENHKREQRRRMKKEASQNPNGKKIHEANMQRMKDKEQSKKEFTEFMAAWRKKWAHVLRKRGHAQRAHQKKRQVLMKLSTNPNDKALAGQINQIQNGACSCYWCGVFMPNGGTVDHIVALSKKGSHTSANICASCPSCNSRKGDRTPEQCQMTGTLL